MSNDENMKDPLLPADSFALKSWEQFESVLSDSSIMAGVMLSIRLIAWKTEGAHSITYTSSLIVIVSKSSYESRWRADLASFKIDLTCYDI